MILQVAERQQKKLEEPVTKKTNSRAKANTKKGCAQKKKSPEAAINGVLEGGLNPPSEECSVSSMTSTTSSDSAPPPLISFQGVLQNGLSVSHLSLIRSGCMRCGVLYFEV